MTIFYHAVHLKNGQDLKYTLFQDLLSGGGGGGNIINELGPFLLCPSIHLTLHWYLISIKEWELEQPLQKITFVFVQKSAQLQNTAYTCLWTLGLGLGLSSLLLRLEKVWAVFYNCPPNLPQTFILWFTNFSINRQLCHISVAILDAS